MKKVKNPELLTKIGFYPVLKLDFAELMGS